MNTTTMPDPIPENSIRDTYRQRIKEKGIRLGKIAATVTLLVLPYFMYEDSAVHALPRGALVFRILPCLVAACLLACHLTPLVRRLTFMNNLLIALMAVTMIMSSGLLIMTVHTPSYHTYVMGMVVAIFSIFAASVYSVRVMIPLYGIPLAGIVLYFALCASVPFEKIMVLSNPITTAIVCVLLSQIHEKLRYSEHKSERMVDLKNRQLSNELELAQSVQNNLIPFSMPQLDGVAFASFYKPMIGIGGDFFDFIRFREKNRIGIFLCDVSGHGVPAALIASMFKTLITAAGPKINSPASLLQFMNAQLVGKTGGHFITAFYGIVDIEEKTLHYARSGHHYPYLIRNGRVTEIRSAGPFLGLIRDIAIEEREIGLRGGDRIIFYTDGLTESRNGAGIEFESTLFTEVLPNTRADGIEEYVRSLYDSLLAFRGHDRFDDDICIVGMELE